MPSPTALLPLAVVRQLPGAFALGIRKVMSLPISEGAGGQP